MNGFTVLNLPQTTVDPKYFNQVFDLNGAG